MDVSSEAQRRHFAKAEVSCWVLRSDGTEAEGVLEESSCELMSKEKEMSFKTFWRFARCAIRGRQILLLLRLSQLVHFRLLTTSRWSIRILSTRPKAILPSLPLRDVVPGFSGSRKNCLSGGLQRNRFP